MRELGRRLLTILTPPQQEALRAEFEKEIIEAEKENLSRVADQIGEVASGVITGGAGQLLIMSTTANPPANQPAPDANTVSAPKAKTPAGKARELQELLFKDDFTHGLSDKWQVVGLKQSDYRVRQGGLEIRVQPGKPTRNTPMLKVILPFTSADTVIVSVKVSLLDEFTQDHEFAGVYLLDESGPEFAAKKERIDGKLVFAPGNDIFIGSPGEEGTRSRGVTRSSTPPLRRKPDRCESLWTAATPSFKSGPSAKDEYLNFFYSAIRAEKKERGFGLMAAGAPEGASHWVRFEDFRVESRTAALAVRPRPRKATRGIRLTGNVATVVFAAVSPPGAKGGSPTLVKTGSGAATFTTALSFLPHFSALQRHFDPTLQKELRLSVEQSKRLSEVSTEFWTKFE